MLLAAISGRPARSWLEFAHEVQPFVRNSKGYFKGNLYPYPCVKGKRWSMELERERGMTAIEYRAWCDVHRPPVIKSWVDEYQPRLFLGFGSAVARQFSRCYFGEAVPMNAYKLTMSKGQAKRLRHARRGGCNLVVLSDPSSGYNALDTDESIERLGQMIRDLVAQVP